MRKTQKRGLCCLTWGMVNVSTSVATPGRFAAGYRRREYACAGARRIVTMRQATPRTSTRTEKYTRGTMNEVVDPVDHQGQPCGGRGDGRCGGGVDCSRGAGRRFGSGGHSVRDCL